MIKLESLTKKYGKISVLDDINMEIEDGIHGFLGQNGSGKTTLLKILATLVKPTSGNVFINGIPLQERKKIRRTIGYIPQEFGLYPEFSCYEILDYLLLLDGVNEFDTRKKVIINALDMVNLSGVIKEKVKNLSGGMRRRLCISQALMLRPRLIIADEPTANLDPKEREAIRSIFLNIKSESSILIATHIMDDVQSCCDSVSVMNKGKVIFNGCTSKLMNNIENGDSIEKAYLELISKDTR